MEERTTLNLNADPRRDLANLSQGCDSRPSKAKANGKCSHKCRVHEINECQDDMNDLEEQVQSLFYN